MKGARFMQTITNSSNIAGLDVDGDNLVVEFKNGRRYQYDGLGHAFDQLITEAGRPSGSVGKLFNALKVGYEFREVTDG